MSARPKKKPRKGKRPPDPTKALRVQEVLQLRLNGAEFYDLQVHAQEHEWNVSDRTLWRYVAAADRLIGQSLEDDRDKLIRRHVAQRRSLYARALNDGDLRTALAIVKDEAEIQGLYAPKKIAPTSPDGTEEWHATDADATGIF